MLGVKLSDLVYPRNWAFQVIVFFFFKLNFFSYWLDKKLCFSFEGTTLAEKLF